MSSVRPTSLAACLILWVASPAVATQPNVEPSVSQPPGATPLWFRAPATVTAPAAEQAFRRGEYEQVLALLDGAGHGLRSREDWSLSRLRTLATLGRYDEAASELPTILQSSAASIRLRWLGRDIYRMVGRDADADRLMAELRERLRLQGWRYRMVADDLITVGRVQLEDGADAKSVLEGVYATARIRGAGAVEAELASGELALAKEDFALAAESFQKAAEQSLVQGDPRIPYGLARAYAPSDREKATEFLREALKFNPRHVPSLLFSVGLGVDAETTDQAKAVLRKVEAVNPRHPLLWANRAAIAHLSGDAATRDAAVAKALATWDQNPEVPHLIGRRLSRKYRFADAAGWQRKALAMDPGYQPARIALAQDLLRLGEEEEGWDLAGEVTRADPYNTLAYNLTELRSRLADKAILTHGRFRVRMNATEAAVYGDRVLDLLERAEAELASRYRTTLPPTVLVDLFDRQSDFAIRTFGLPGGFGYLGVCFGPTITMNSATALPSVDASWESVLWHEFTHTVTLTKTENRMPRWLSEGISVYEERRADPAWGRSMTPALRVAIERDGVLPISRLSGAFLGEADVTMAYFQAGLAVEFLVAEFGFDALLAILDDIRGGLTARDALARHTLDSGSLDALFDRFVQTRTRAYGRGLDFTPLPPNFDPSTLRSFLAEHPEHYFALVQRAAQKRRAAKPREAVAILNDLIARFERPPVELLVAKATLYDQASDLATEADRDSLTAAIAAADPTQVDTVRAAMDAAAADDRWGDAERLARSLVSTQPMATRPYEVLLAASEQQSDPRATVDAAGSLLALDPVDPSGLRLRRAKAYGELGDRRQARRDLLLSLERTPRYEAAQRLLLELVDARDAEVSP